MGLRKYLWTATVATFNMTVVVVAVLLVVWHAGKYRMKFHPSEMPTVWRALWEIVLCILYHDVAFYYFHRLCNELPNSTKRGEACMCLRVYLWLGRERGREGGRDRGKEIHSKAN